MFFGQKGGIRYNYCLFRENHLAEREGFEPPDPLRSTVFKTAAIDHSAIFPVAFGNKRTETKSGAKVLLFFEIHK